MNILVTIPHYYKQGQDRRYGSSVQKPKARARQLLKTILQLHQNFGHASTTLDISQKKAFENGANDHQIDIVLSVHQDDHLLHILKDYQHLFRVVTTEGDPKELGFKCHQVMFDHEGYDRYLYLEDDLLIHDTSYFLKLDFIENQLGKDVLLQPHRFERSPNPTTFKCYVDGPLKEDLTRAYMNNSMHLEHNIEWGFSQLTIKKALNPHAGTFCLSASQYEHWKTSTQHHDIDTSFIGPLESAATLSILKCFEVYKTIDSQSHLFEIEHQGKAFISQVINGRIPKA